MTAADRLRAAVEAALCNCEAELEPHEIAHRRWCYALLRGPSVLRAVLPIVEERDAEVARLRARHNPEVCVDVQEHNAAQGREVARLRAVLEWVYEGPIDSVGVIDMALRGDWPAVRAAGVALPGEEG